jgi:hypothetical protein
MFTLRHAAYRMLGVGLASCYLGACAEVQMDYNVLTYDSAIADSGNQLLLLNAVRASQHYPRSFTSAGALLAGPPVSGGIGSTLNFNQLARLQNFSLTPAIAANAGYASFGLANLNTQEFMNKMRLPVSIDIIKAFENNPSWPRQLLDILYFQRFSPSVPMVRIIDIRRKSKCAASATTGTRKACENMNERIAKYSARCTPHALHFINPDQRMLDFHDDPRMYYNSAANYCQFERFRIFLEEVRLVGFPICIEKPQPGCLMASQRSALDLIGYLGELVAAQNYVDDPFMPLVRIGVSVGPTFDFVDVPLFEVRRGEPLGNAAVIVRHDGVPFYIPRPDFGSPLEQRSLQTLELVLQTVQAATQQKDLPSTIPTVAIAKQ